MIYFNEVPSSVEKFLERIKDKLEIIVEKEIGNVDISFVFIDPQLMSEMNMRFRKKEGPTDVLTFIYGDEEFTEFEQSTSDMAEGLDELNQAKENLTIYSEGYLCLEKIKENSEAFENPFEKELLTVLVHSILHMAGYDHEYNSQNAQEMFRKQSEYVEKIWESLPE
ncbi:MAG: rRNA maturation RNase YbeY [Fervidobacterium sp.]